MTEQGDSPPDDDPAGGPERVLTLTDGVVAIAMTLLALDLRPDLAGQPSSRRLADYFLDDPGPYIAFLLAFVLIAQYWVVHHRMLRAVTRHDNALTWANMLFLFGITLLPLTSYVTGNYGAPLATTIFAGNLVLLSVSLAVLTEVISKRGLRAVPPTPDARLRGRSREVVTVVVPLVVAVLTWFTPHASYLFFLFVVADVPGRLLVRRRRRSAGAPDRGTGAGPRPGVGRTTGVGRTSTDDDDDRNP